MHRNTYLLVIVLAVFAALLIGVNIGKRLQKQPASPSAPTPIPTTSTKIYMNTYCGFSLSYPASYTVLENASGSAILHNTADKTESITLTCQKAIPRPALPSDKIETFVLSDSSMSATLYHDSSGRDGTPIDVLIFRHPRGMDIFIAGYGEAFNAAIKTLQILP